MPIYEYRCAACGRSFERLVHGQQAVACPACDSPDVTRLLSLFGFKSGQGFVASASRRAAAVAAAAGAGAAATDARATVDGAGRAARGRWAPFAFLAPGPS